MHAPLVGMRYAAGMKPEPRRMEAGQSHSANHLALVLTTVATREQAQALALAMVQQELAACVHLQRVDSVYRWRGQIHEEPEWRLLCKTTVAAAPRLQAALRAAHPYEQPVLYALDASTTDAATLAWLQGQPA